MTSLERLKQIEKEHKVKFHIPAWEHSAFQERLMRFGKEYRYHGLESPFDAKTERLVIESFITDFVQKYERNIEFWKQFPERVNLWIETLANTYRLK